MTPLERSTLRARLKTAMAEATGLHFALHPLDVLKGGATNEDGCFAIVLDWTNTGTGPYNPHGTKHGQMKCRWSITVQVVTRINDPDQIESPADVLERKIIDTLHREFGPLTGPGGEEFAMDRGTDPRLISGDWHQMDFACTLRAMRDCVSEG